MRFEKPYRPTHQKSCRCYECSVAFRLMLSLRLDFASRQEDIVQALTEWGMERFGEVLPLVLAAELEGQGISDLIDRRTMAVYPPDAKQQSFLLEALSRQQDVVEGLTRYFPDGVRQLKQGENNGEENEGCGEEGAGEHVHPDGFGLQGS